MGLILNGALGSANRFTLRLWVRRDGRKDRLESSQEQSRGPRREASQDPRPAPWRGKAPEDCGWQERRRVRVSHRKLGKSPFKQKTGQFRQSRAERW